MFWKRFVSWSSEVLLLTQQTISQHSYNLLAPHCMLQIALSIITCVQTWNFYFQLLHPAVLGYEQAVNRQTIKTQLYEIIIYSSKGFDTMGVIITLISSPISDISLP